MGRGFLELNLSSIYKLLTFWSSSPSVVKRKKNIHTVSAAWAGSRFNEIMHTWNPGECMKNRINASLIPTLLPSARLGLVGAVSNSLSRI